MWLQHSEDGDKLKVLKSAPASMEKSFYILIQKIYLSTSSWRQSSNLPSMKRQRKATLFFPCSFAREASFVIPSASPSAEYRSKRPLRSMACVRHCSAISNCTAWLTKTKFNLCLYAAFLETL